MTLPKGKKPWNYKKNRDNMFAVGDRVVFYRDEQAKKDRRRISGIIVRVNKKEGTVIISHREISKFNRPISAVSKVQPEND